MILIKKNSINNNIVLTLSENVTLTGDNVYFLFKFSSDDTRDDVIFTAEDLSTNPSRYNKFTITETGSTDTNLTAGTINLVPQGYWDYEVYQMTGQTNTALSGVTGGPIEYGKVLVSGTSQNSITSTYTGKTSQYSVYK